VTPERALGIVMTILIIVLLVVLIFAFADGSASLRFDG
jgi:hypothetical protein